MQAGRPARTLSWGSRKHYPHFFVKKFLLSWTWIMISSCAVNIKRKLTQFAISWFWQICNLAFPIPRPPSFKLPCYCCWPKAFWTRSSTTTSTSSSWAKGEKIYHFMISISPWMASAGEIVRWKYIIGEEGAAVNVKRREMAGSKKGDRKGDCSYKTPPHHNLATLIIIWSFILSQVLSSIFVSWERVVKKYSTHPLHSLVPLNA